MESEINISFIFRLDLENNIFLVIKLTLIFTNIYSFIFGKRSVLVCSEYHTVSVPTQGAKKNSVPTRCHT